MDKPIMKKPLLVPVDFSTHSEAALVKACELAFYMKNPLLVLHVVHDPVNMPGYYSRYYSKIASNQPLIRLEDIAQQMFDEFIEMMIEKYPELPLLKKLDKMLVVGIPVTRILEIIEKKDIEMVIMGSQGRTGLRQIMLGSKAEQMVRFCPVPITIVKSISTQE